MKKFLLLFLATATAALAQVSIPWADIADKPNLTAPTFSGGVVTPSISTSSGNLTLSPATVSSGMAGSHISIPAGPIGDGINGGYAPIRWGNGSKYSLVGGGNAFDIDGGISGARSIPDLAGGIAYNAQKTSGDVAFGWQFESRYAGTTELYYSWSGVMPGEVGNRRPIQLNTSWGPGYGTGGAWPADTAAGTTAMSLHVDRLWISGANPFSNQHGLEYIYAPFASTFTINAATSVDSLTVENGFVMTAGILNVTSNSADVATFRNSASSAAVRFGRDFTNSRNSGNLQFSYVGSGSGLNSVGLGLYGSADSLTVYDTATASSSTTTGAVVVTGGLGVSGAVNTSGAITSGSTVEGNYLRVTGGSTYEVAELTTSNGFGSSIRFGRDVTNGRNSGNLAFNWVGSGNASNSVGIGLYGIADSAQFFQNGTASSSKTTGTVTVAGGLGVTGAVNAGSVTADTFGALVVPSNQPQLTFGAGTGANLIGFLSAVSGRYVALSGNRNPATAVFANTGGSHAEMAFDTGPMDGHVTFRTSASNNALGTVAVKINKNQGLEIYGTTAAASATTGSLLNAGGFGNAGALFNGAQLSLTSTSTGYIEGVEQSSSPAAPAANAFRLFAKDNGSGKTVLFVRFASGAEQQVAIEP